MKIVARIRQLLAAKHATVAPQAEDVPLPIPAPAEQELRREVEPSATQRPPQRSSPPRTKTGYRLEGEGIAVPIADPSADVIRRELERLRTSGPSFVALIAPDGSYLQAAGNAKRMAVEGHIVSAEGTTHVVLGRQGPPGSPIRLGFTAGQLALSATEVWAAPEVSNLFAEFSQTGSISSDLSRRDITADIANG